MFEKKSRVKLRIFGKIKNKKLGSLNKIDTSNRVFHSENPLTKFISTFESIVKWFKWSQMNSNCLCVHLKRSVAIESNRSIRIILLTPTRRRKKKTRNEFTANGCWSISSYNNRIEQTSHRQESVYIYLTSHRYFSREKRVREKQFVNQNASQFMNDSNKRPLFSLSIVSFKL